MSNNKNLKQKIFCCCYFWNQIKNTEDCFQILFNLWRHLYQILINISERSYTVTWFLDLMRSGIFILYLIYKLLCINIFTIYWCVTWNTVLYINIKIKEDNISIGCIMSVIPNYECILQFFIKFLLWLMIILIRQQ